MAVCLSDSCRAFLDIHGCLGFAGYYNGWIKLDIDPFYDGGKGHGRTLTVNIRYLVNVLKVPPFMV
jgi:hypothetical protein